MTAISARAGHCVQIGSGEWLPIDYVSSEIAQGLYNPQTFHGDIVVNNVRVTTYTAIVNLMSAHAMLLPLRVAHRLQVMMKELSGEPTT